MIRLSWRQFRSQAVVALGLLVAVAVVFASTRPHLVHIYNVYDQAQAACRTAPDCRHVSIDIGQFDRLLELIGTALVAVPALIGAFWGAPLIARELEHGTQRLVWTQSVSRIRWVSVKLALVGGASVVVTALLSLLVTWWSKPIDRSDMNRFGSGLFGERNLTPLGYAAFGFALGVSLGLVIRRTLPAMAATLGVFLGVRLAFTYLVRPHLLPARHLSQPLDAAGMGFGSTNGGPDTLMPNSPDLPNAWIYSTRIVDGGGHGLTSQTLNAVCPDLGQSLAPPPDLSGVARGPVPASAQNALETCATKLSGTYHQLVVYQPASRYWILQGYETAIFALLAALLVGFILWRLRRR